MLNFIVGIGGFNGMENRFGGFTNAEAIGSVRADKALDQIGADHRDHVVPKAIDVIKNEQWNGDRLVRDLGKRHK